MELAQHGVLWLSLAIFIQALGLPVPAAVALILAAAQSARGHLSPVGVCGGSLLAMVSGDALMYLLGRKTGWWLLGTLCRVSLNPESCVVSSADTFHRRGRSLLVVAKFLPGINTMAPPLAGSMHMRWWSFLWLDAAGSMLYIGAYFIVGFLCSDAIADVLRFYERFGHLTTAVVLILATAYAVWLAWSAWKAHGLGKLVPHAPAAIVAHDVGTGDAVVFDVRSHGYFDSDAMRIPGSTRVDPNALRASLEKFSKDRQIYLYCTCQRQATAVQVARELLKLGFKVAVIKDGWAAGAPPASNWKAVPPTDVTVLPFFT